MQKAIVVSYVPGNAKPTGGIDELNKLLEAGWTVQNVHPMTPAAAGEPIKNCAVAFATLIIVHDANAKAPKAPAPQTVPPI
jgi:hypothetical protein